MSATQSICVAWRARPGGEAAAAQDPAAARSRFRRTLLLQNVSAVLASRRRRRWSGRPSIRARLLHSNIAGTTHMIQVLLDPARPADIDRRGLDIRSKAEMRAHVAGRKIARRSRYRGPL